MVAIKFLERPWKQAADYLPRKIRDMSVDKGSGSGRLKTIRTGGNIDVVNELKIRCLCPMICDEKLNSKQAFPEGAFEGSLNTI